MNEFNNSILDGIAYLKTIRFLFGNSNMYNNSPKVAKLFMYQFGPFGQQCIVKKGSKCTILLKTIHG